MSDWIDWEPVLNPVPGATVEYKLRQGDTDIEDADGLDWAHCGDQYDIVAYRIVAAGKPRNRDGEVG